MTERLFSLDEANELLPALRPLLREIQKEWEFLTTLNHDIRAAAQQASAGGGSLFGSYYVESAERVALFLARINDYGVLLKDPQEGLCDFPHKCGDRIVHLCWKLDEDAIEWWHDAEGGYADRQSLSELYDSGQEGDE